MISRPCEACGDELPLRARKGTRFCSTRCRMRAHREGAVPKALRDLDRWVTYSVRKVPLTPRGRPASSTDPRTWSPFTALDGMDRKGFVLNGDGIVCIDLDHCLIGDRLSPLAAEVLAECPSTYVEVSMSGEGLHVWGRASLPAGRRLNVSGQAVEVYPSGRFIAVTGRRFRNASSSLGDLQAVCDRLLT